MLKSVFLSAVGGASTVAEGSIAVGGKGIPLLCYPLLLSAAALEMAPTFVCRKAGSFYLLRLGRETLRWFMLPQR